MNARLNDSLQPLLAWYDAASETLPGLAVVAYDSDLTILWSQGDPPTSAGIDPARLVGVPIGEVLPASIWSKMENSLRDALKGVSCSFEMPFSDGDCLHWIEVAPLRKDGLVVGGVMSTQDVAERLIAEQDLLELTGSFEAAFAKAPIGMSLVALDGTLIRVNPAFGRISGYSPRELETVRIQDMIPVENHEHDLIMMTKLISGEIDNYVTEMQLLGKGDREIWAMLAASVVRDEGGDALHLIVQVQDITGRKELETELRRVAGEDPLTGLANRRRFEEVLSTQIERSRRYDETAALLMFDLDDFKSVNDTHGHSIGDDLLIFVAGQLSARMRSSDLVARPGGDEFSVIAIDSDEDRARALVDELTGHFDGLHYETDGRRLSCRASIGATVIDSSAETMDEVLSRADRAMYEAKNARQAADDGPHRSGR